jgi:diaminohydroxyphosphoribosylaminopyrimidine deaminase/5-amino-6-(5-phosphoribosylamino)uracil reductase
MGRKAWGRTSPNPPVGAVVVKDGKVVGEGATHRPGGPHAEVVALRKAGEAAHGATLYVTLEPCSHFGRTPPCADAVVEAGVRRVVCCLQDPNPLVAGQGLQRLRDAGIEVVLGPLRDEAEHDLEPYLKAVWTGLPFVTLKLALSLDGKIATREGDSRWISSEASRRLVHRLRARSDAVLVGVGTALADDPELTPRLARPLRAGYPRRVIVDSRARLPLKSKALSRELAPTTIVAVTEGAKHARVAALERTGAEVWLVRPEAGRVDLVELLRRLCQTGYQSLLVEGGGELAAGLLEAGLVDKALLFYAPILLGGKSATSAIAGRGVASVAEAPRLRDLRYRPSGPDLMVEGYVVRPEGAGE